MQITDIRIRKVNTEGRMKAVVSVTFDDAFVVHDIKVIESQEGKLFTAMPSRKTPDGEYKDIAHPINSETRTDLNEQILEKYRQVLDETPEFSELSLKAYDFGRNLSGDILINYLSRVSAFLCLHSKSGGANRPAAYLTIANYLTV